SMNTLTQLRAEGWVWSGIGATRALLVIGALSWSAWLGARIVSRSDASPARRALALGLYTLPLALFGAAWYLNFVVW
ncbi:MAG: 4Fe-4S binding protein, partial [Burkholderiaceae bacterium]|nr:4Fe-4S binding protein [Burkholderiaceae bacterium]